MGRGILFLQPLLASHSRWNAIVLLPLRTSWGGLHGIHYCLFAEACLDVEKKGTEGPRRGHGESPGFPHSSSLTIPVLGPCLA